MHGMSSPELSRHKSQLDATGISCFWVSKVESLPPQHQSLVDASWAHHRLPVHVLQHHLPGTRAPHIGKHADGFTADTSLNAALGTLSLGISCWCCWHCTNVADVVLTAVCRNLLHEVPPLLYEFDRQTKP